LATPTTTSVLQSQINSETHASAQHLPDIEMESLIIGIEKLDSSLSFIPRGVRKKDKGPGTTAEKEGPSKV
jgi:hypothetical protein